ncbi:unnamed protein product, partial [Ixodes persulcatus]
MRSVLAGRGDLGGFPDHVEEMPWRMRRGACGLWCWPSTDPGRRTPPLELELPPLLRLLPPSVPKAGVGVAPTAEAVRRWPSIPANDRLRDRTPPGGGSGDCRDLSRSLSDM